RPLRRDPRRDRPRGGDDLARPRGREPLCRVARTRPMSAPGLAVREPATGRWRALLASDAVVRLLAGLVILLAWEGAARIWGPPFLAKPSGIVAVFPNVITSADFWRMAGSTLGAVFEGLAIAFVTGTVLGVAIGRIRTVDR